MNDKKKEYLADLSLVLMAAIWGSGFIFTKQALESYGSFQVLFIRFLIASLTLLIININKLKLLNKDTLKTGGFIGMFLFFGFIFQTLGLENSPAGKSAFLTSSYVAFVPLITLLITKQKPDKYNVFAAILMIVGMFLLMIDLKSGFYIESYDVLTLIGAVFWGLHVASVGIFSKKHDPMLLVMFQMMMACLLSGIAMILAGETSVEIQKNTLFGLMYLGIFCSAITFAIQNVAQKFTNSTRASIIMSLESVFGTIFGILFLNEHFTFQMILGFIVIFIALIMAETKFSFLRKEKV